VAGTGGRAILSAGSTRAASPAAEPDESLVVVPAAGDRR